MNKHIICLNRIDVDGCIITTDLMVNRHPYDPRNIKTRWIVNPVIGVVI